MKNLLLFVIENKILFALLGILLFVLALFNIDKLNVEAFPDPSPAVVEVATIYNGRSSEEVEKEIIIPLETALSSMPHMKRINSSAIYGLADIKITFDYDISYEKAKQHVINRLTQANLPSGVQPFIMSSQVGEVMRFEVRSTRPDVSLTDLRTLLDGRISRQIKTVPGIEDCNTIGGLVKQYQVIISPSDMIRYGLNYSQVESAIQNANSNVGGNYLVINNRTFDIRGIGLIQSIDDIRHTSIINPNGLPVDIGKIGQVKVGNAPILGHMGLTIKEASGTYSKDDAVVGYALLRKDEKSIPALKALDAKIKELNQFYAPQGVQIVPYYQRMDLVHTVIHKMIETGAIGLTLITFIIILFLGDLVTALIVASIVPISFLLTLTLLAINGDSANLISLGAVDFGIIADAAILFIENIFRLSKNNTVTGAIVEAGNDIGKPLLFSILIIITSFIPLFTMSGAEGVLFTPMAKTYVFALTFAVILTFMFLPAMISLIKKDNLHHNEIPIIRSLIIIYNGLLAKLMKHYKIGLIIAGVILTAALISVKFVGTEFMPTMDEGNIYMRVLFQSDIALTMTHDYSNKIRKIVAAYPEVIAIDSKSGRPEDGTEATGAYNTEYSIVLKPYSQWPKGVSKEKFQEELRQEISKIVPKDTDISFSQYIQDNLNEVSSGVKGSNSLKIVGPDLNELDKYGKQAEQIMKDIPGLSEVGLYQELGQPNLYIRIDREKTSLYGLSTQDILNIIDMSIGGSPVTQILEGDMRFDLDIILPQSNRNSIDAIKNIPIVLADGSTIPLWRVADVGYDTGAFFIYRENYARFIPVKFEVTSSDFGGTVEKAQQAVESQVHIPPTYKFVWSGSYQEMKESQKRLLIIVPIAILITLIILFIYFKSLRYTFTAFASALFAIGSGVLGLLITGIPLSVSSIVGFISIMGVSVMNGTVIVSHFMFLYQVGLEKEKAILETMADKFKPVLMTGLVAALGLLPAALTTGVGSQVQKPLAIVVVFGLIIGTIATLFVLPLILRVVPDKKELHLERELKMKETTDHHY